MATPAVLKFKESKTWTHFYKCLMKSFKRWYWLQWPKIHLLSNLYSLCFFHLPIALLSPENIIIHPLNHPSVSVFDLCVPCVFQAPEVPTAVSTVTWAQSFGLCSPLNTTLTPSTKTESTPNPTLEDKVNRHKGMEVEGNRWKVICWRS